MVAAAVYFILFAAGTGNAPDLAALASYQDRETCQAAAAQITAALEPGEDRKVLFCIASDSLQEMAQKNGVGPQ